MSSVLPFGGGDSGFSNIYGKKIHKGTDFIFLLSNLDHTVTFLAQCRKTVTRFMINENVGDTGIVSLKCILEDSTLCLYRSLNIMYRAMSYITDVFTDTQHKDLDDYVIQATNDMETLIRNIERNLPPLSDFVIPCANKYSSKFDFARTQTRMTEVLYWRLVEDNDKMLDKNFGVIGTFLNRLSKLLFDESRLFKHLYDLKESPIRDGNVELFKDLK